MLLKVGELARRSGLTVRALHHFHEIGLLTPSVRSEAGYRLYDRQDVARLHAIQSLRALGVPLKQIGGMLAGDGSDLPSIVARQMRALDRQIEQATALRQRLALLGEMLAGGRQPEVEDWLGTLELMNTYARYFSADEIRRIVGHWPRVAGEWPRLLTDLRAAMERGLAPADPQVQALVQRWMALVHHWLDGDFDLMRRWGDVYAAEPGARGPGGPGPDLVRFVGAASEVRMALWLRHFTLAEMARFRRSADAGLQRLQDDVTAALARGETPRSPAAAALGGRWRALLTEVAGGDAALGERILKAYAADPALHAGARLSSASIGFLAAATAIEGGGHEGA